MTIQTIVAVHRPVNVPELYRFARELVNTPEDAPWPTSQPYGAARSLAHEPGLGALAILRIVYGVDGPLYDEETRGPLSPLAYGWSALMISFEGSNRDHDLHAYLADSVGKWVARRRCYWIWHLEINNLWYSRRQIYVLGDVERGRAIAEDARRS